MGVIIGALVTFLHHEMQTTSLDAEPGSLRTSWNWAALGLYHLTPDFYMGQHFQCAYILGLQEEGFMVGQSAMLRQNVPGALWASGKAWEKVGQEQL